MIPTVLCILDGYGLNPELKGNAVAMAKKPILDSLFASVPNTVLTTHGEAVGLPEGQMGNSEVGHLNIGAGRIVEQWLLKVAKGLTSDKLEVSEKFIVFKTSLKAESSIHLVGLCSSGGVHSDLAHLEILVPALLRLTSQRIVIHLVTDGRDVSPHDFLQELSRIEKLVAIDSRIKIASISGRFYAMDRDRRFERTQAAYKAIVEADAPVITCLREYVSSSYESGVTDEFIEPRVVEARPIEKDDAIIFWNFRSDRMRQLVEAICLGTFSGFERRQALPEKCRVLCFSEYDRTFFLPHLFELDEIKSCLGEVVSKAGLRQLRVAETEKYPHVTYFLNGGAEVEFAGEERKMCPSPRDVKTYDQKPEMSATEVYEIVCKALREDKYQLIIVNFANCDMVGHTGVFDAAVKAVETVDACLGKILEVLDASDGQALIIADHGNAELMINYQTGQPHTAHTTFPVPCLLVSEHLQGYNLRDSGALCDVAPTLLQMLQLEQPKEMSGKSLLVSPTKT